MTTSLVRTRYGAAADLARVAALHDRCTTETLHRRFHAPGPVMSERVLRQLIEPEHGWSILAEHGRDPANVVAMASAGPVSTREVEVGILVEDLQQARGIGTRLLRESADAAARRGYRAMLCLTQPDNRAVVATVARAGLPCTTTWDDGLMCLVMDLRAAGHGLPRPA